MNRVAKTTLVNLFSEVANETNFHIHSMKRKLAHDCVIHSMKRKLAHDCVEIVISQLNMNT